MARFCVTARISSPSRREAQHRQQRDKHREREADDPQPVIGDGDAAEIEGAAHPGRVADLAVVRAEDGAHRLLQDQRQAPGGEQRFQRPAVEEADDAALDRDADGARRPGRRAARRSAANSRTGAGYVGADDLLHHEGGVGAEHHHLAMRHVDDAHHAEGDGEADGGEQQHRAEREAVPGVLHGVHRSQVALDRGGWRRRRPWRASAAASAGRRRQQAERILVAAVADHGDGGELVGRRWRHRTIAERWRRALRSERALDARHRFPWQCALSSAGSALVVARLEHGLRGVAALARIGRHQRQAAERGIDARRAAGC